MSPSPAPEPNLARLRSAIRLALATSGRGITMLEVSLILAGIGIAGAAIWSVFGADRAADLAALGADRRHAKRSQHMRAHLRVARAGMPVRR